MMAGAAGGQLPLVSNLAQSAAGESTGESIQQNLSVRPKRSTTRKSTLAKKGKPKRNATKRPRQELSVTPGSHNQSESGSVFNGYVSDDVPIRIPCQEGCGLSFATVNEADAHVKTFHSGPRIDQLRPTSLSLANNVQGRVSIHSKQSTSLSH